MTDRPCRFLWLEGIFDEATVGSFLSISPASNFWQKGFVQALLGLGCRVDLIGYPVERVWPFGRLIIRGQDASLLPGIAGQVLGYVNLPVLRDRVQYHAMHAAAIRYLQATENRPDYQIVFSCLEKATDETAAIRAARHLRKLHGIPWICIVADGHAPAGADGYVYLPWAYYQVQRALDGKPSIHIDGGVPEISACSPYAIASMGAGQERVLMYMGALTRHGGALELAQAFNQVPDANIRLWVCGRGGNPDLDALASRDPRIKIKGFLAEAELNKLASMAFAFANPRPVSFAPNKLNYPSKLLHYLAFGKPVISTFTDGVSPEYKDILIPIQDESQSSLIAAINEVMSLGEDQYRLMQKRMASFNRKRTWSAQAARFMTWLQQEVLLERKA